jgi:hypothetical protein
VVKKLKYSASNYNFLQVVPGTGRGQKEKEMGERREDVLRLRSCARKREDFLAEESCI